MGRRLLVVDDEPDIAKTTALALELNGYEVSIAQTVRQAVEKVGLERPDLVILDMFLPDGTGAAVVRWIRGQEAHRHIPVIIITAMAQKDEQAVLEGEQVDCRMIKPFDLEQLEAKVSELLGDNHD